MEILKVKCKWKSPSQVANEISFYWCVAHYHMRSTSRGWRGTQPRDIISDYDEQPHQTAAVGFLPWLGKNWKINTRLDDDRVPPHTAPPPPPPPPILGRVCVCVCARPSWGHHRGTRLIRPMRWCSLMLVPTIKDAPHLTASIHRHFIRYIYSVVVTSLLLICTYHIIVLQKIISKIKFTCTGTKTSLRVKY